MILWPSYFDSRKKRSSGRRVPKSLAVEKPTVEELFKAVNSLGLEVTILADKAYPSNWWEHEGCVSVEKSLPKTELISKVATKLKAIKSQ
ncbi:MAG: signal recognition particle protein Srp19 [Thermoplasmata archaeon]|nr:signal recognition particle protein Srp19 [Thermoplasmata archaeon]MCK5397871.1 signal recognition particle protein Srp19 [Thermoplasmata archaeon]